MGAGVVGALGLDPKENGHFLAVLVCVCLEALSPLIWFERPSQHGWGAPLCQPLQPWTCPSENCQLLCWVPFPPVIPSVAWTSVLLAFSKGSSH